MKPEVIRMDPLDRADQQGYQAGLRGTDRRPQYLSSDELFAWYQGRRRGERERQQQAVVIRRAA